MLAQQTSKLILGGVALALAALPSLAAQASSPPDSGMFSAEDAPSNSTGLETYVCSNGNDKERWINILTPKGEDRTFLVTVYDKYGEMVGYWAFTADSYSSVPVPPWGHVVVQDAPDKDDKDVVGGWYFDPA